MSQRGINAGRMMIELAVGILLALLLPLIVSFLIYLVASAIPATYLPAITYGIFTYTSTNAPAGLTIPSGVAYLWIVTDSTGSISSSSPAFPLVLINVLNGVLIFISILVAVLIGIKFVPELIEYIGSQ